MLQPREPLASAGQMKTRYFDPSNGSLLYGVSLLARCTNPEQIVYTGALHQLPVLGVSGQL